VDTQKRLFRSWGYLNSVLLPLLEWMEKSVFGIFPPTNWLKNLKVIRNMSLGWISAVCRIWDIWSLLAVIITRLCGMCMSGKKWLYYRVIKLLYKGWNVSRILLRLWPRIFSMCSKYGICALFPVCRLWCPNII
jgi:hypothetical protein